MRPLLAMVMVYALHGGYAVASAAPQSATRESFGHSSARETLTARFYRLPDTTRGLPHFEALNPMGSLYAPTLELSGQGWPSRLPTVTDADARYGIDYRGSFTSVTPGAYQFTLISDGPARLLIDGRLVIDSDGRRGQALRSSPIAVGPGRHSLEAQYAHPPGRPLRLQVRCQGPDGREAVFPRCGLALRRSALWRSWLWWVAALAGLGAAVTWQTRRRIALENRGR